VNLHSFEFFEASCKLKDKTKSTYIYLFLVKQEVADVDLDCLQDIFIVVNTQIQEHILEWNGDLICET